MVNYICQRCGYTTNRKSNLKNHFKRKKICPPILKDYNIKKLCKINKIQYKDVKPSKQKKEIKCQPNVSQKRLTLSKNVSQNVSQNKQNGFFCSYCLKKFTTRQAKFKHEKDRCKHKTDVPPSNLDLLIKQKDNIIENLIKQIDLIVNKNISCYNSNSNNINSNNITNNIQINNYGEENIEYITNNVLKKLLNYPASAIPKLIAMKHFNPKYPENHNIKITNIHDKFAKRFKNGRWSIEDKKAVISELVEDGFAHYDEFKNLKGEELNHKILEKLNKIEFFIDNKKENLEKTTEITVINGTKEIDV